MVPMAIKIHKNYLTINSLQYKLFAWQCNFKLLSGDWIIRRKAGVHDEG